MAIAIFDFDGTIISRDSLPDFLIQTCGRKAFLLRLPWVILLKGAALTGILSTHRAKELVISSFLRGMKTEDFHQACLKYAHRIPAFVYPAALEERYDGIRKKEIRSPLSVHLFLTGYALGHKQPESGLWKGQSWK